MKRSSAKSVRKNLPSPLFSKEGLEFDGENSPFKKGDEGGAASRVDIDHHFVSERIWIYKSSTLKFLSSVPMGSR